MNSNSPTTVTAEKIINLLNRRKGFDYWWDGIRAEDKDDILLKIQAVVDQDKQAAPSIERIP